MEVLEQDVTSEWEENRERERVGSQKLGTLMMGVRDRGSQHLSTPSVSTCCARYDGQEAHEASELAPVRRGRWEGERYLRVRGTRECHRRCVCHRP